MGYANALEYLDSKLKEERGLIVENLIQGKLEEGEYKRLCGALQGLDLASNYIKDLAKRMEQE
ncbi:hypothetical protein EBT31_07000 [bacterium]|jgi:hypothetical protein|nr:hypothetical protein [bacterium]